MSAFDLSVINIQFNQDADNYKITIQYVLPCSLFVVMS